MLRRYVGRRGVVLLIISSVWILFGLSVVTYDPPPGESGRFRIDLIDTPAWAWLWIGCGVVAAFYAVRRHWRGADALGWAAGIAPPMTWAALYAISFIWSCATDEAIGSDRGWVGFVTWALVVALVRVIAGWEDNLHSPDVVEENR